MWARVRRCFNLSRSYGNRAGAEAARRALEAGDPELSATAVWLQARAVDRDVVAVLYRVPMVPAAGTPRYKLFAVRADLTTEELVVERDSPYAIRGVK